MRNGAAGASCRLCGAAAVRGLADFGPQPLCHRFLAGPGEREYRHPLRLGQCEGCGLLQLRDPVPPAVLRRRGGASYHDPQGHLGRLAGAIAGLPGARKGELVWTVGPAGEALLGPLRARGFRGARPLDLRAGTQTLQRLRPSAARTLARRRGRAAVVAALHVLEHAHDARAFLAALRELARPDGYVVIEVPDSQSALEELDYSVLWEEHALYFTETSLRRAFSCGGLSLRRCLRYPYRLEDSLVGIAQAREPGPAAGASALALEKARARAFAARWAGAGRRLRAFLRRCRREKGPIVLLGAGHRACMFVNLMGLGGLIRFAADEDSRKQGLWTPGSRILLQAPGSFPRGSVGVCLLGVSPDREEEALGRIRSLLGRGAAVYSIYPGSRYALPGEALSGREAS